MAALPLVASEDVRRDRRVRVADVRRRVDVVDRRGDVVGLHRRRFYGRPSPDPAATSPSRASAARSTASPSPLPEPRTRRTQGAAGPSASSPSARRPCDGRRRRWDALVASGGRDGAATAALSTAARSRGRRQPATARDARLGALRPSPGDDGPTAPDFARRASSPGPRHGAGGAAPAVTGPTCSSRATVGAERRSTGCDHADDAVCAERRPCDELAAEDARSREASAGRCCQRGAGPGSAPVTRRRRRRAPSARRGAAEMRPRWRWHGAGEPARHGWRRHDRRRARAAGRRRGRRRRRRLGRPAAGRQVPAPAPPTGAGAGGSGGEARVRHGSRGEQAERVDVAVRLVGDADPEMDGRHAVLGVAARAHRPDRRPLGDRVALRDATDPRWTSVTE